MTEQHATELLREGQGFGDARARRPVYHEPGKRQNEWFLGHPESAV